MRPWCGCSGCPPGLWCGALLVQLGGLALVAAWLWRGLRARRCARARTHGARIARAMAQPVDGALAILAGWLGRGSDRRFRHRAHAAAGRDGHAGRCGAPVGAGAGWIPDRLDGLDGFAGCATAPQSTWFTPNALLLAGLVVGGLCCGPREPAVCAALAHLARRRAGPVGRCAAGLGRQTGLGCTIGTLLSGGMAGALSGCVWGRSVLGGVGGAASEGRTCSQMIEGVFGL